MAAAKYPIEIQDFEKTINEDRLRSRILYRSPWHNRLHFFTEMDLKAIIVSLIFLAVLVCGACRRQPDRQLELAKALMETRPDSALAIMETYRLPDNASKYDKAIYSLLLTQAQYKNYIDIESDSLITRASDYFIDKNHPEEASLSLFLKGMISMDHGSLGNAAVSLTQGFEIAKENRLYLQQGLCARGLYQLYAKLYDGSGQIHYAKEALKAFTKSGREDWIDYARLDLATAYSNSGNYDKAIENASNLLDKATKDGDSILMAESSAILAVADFGSIRNKESLEHYANVNRLDKGILTGHDIDNIIEAGLSLPPDSLSTEIRDMLENIRNRYSNMTPFKVAAARGDYEKAYRSLDRYRMEQDSVLSSLLRGNVFDTLRVYEKNKKTLEYEKIKSERLLWTLVFLVSLIAGGAGIVIMGRHVRQKEDERRAVIVEAENLRSDLRRQIEDNQLISGSIKDLLSQKYSVVNQLCETYYQNQDSKLAKKRIVDEVEQILRQFKDVSATLPEMYIKTDKYFHDIIESFRTDFPNLKDDDLRLFLYAMMGFSARSMAYFLDEKIDVVYNRKSRLKAKIRSCISERKEKYLAIFN